MENLTALQQKLLRIRDEYCGGNAAELARRIKKDATYVNRLFYPPGKAGGKGIGLEIMNACTEAFGLPPGYWSGSAQMAWPFSADLYQSVVGLDLAELKRLETVMRAHLGDPALTSAHLIHTDSVDVSKSNLHSRARLSGDGLSTPPVKAPGAKTTMSRLMDTAPDLPEGDADGGNKAGRVPRPRRGRTDR